MSHATPNPTRPFPAPILMYHHVEPLPLDPPAVYGDSYLDRRRFAEHLDLLRRWRRTPLTLGDALTRWRHGEPFPPRPVVLTFDDACSCFLDHAWPELEARGMTATVFAVSGEIGGSNTWDHAAGERQERLLGGGDLAALAGQGVEIGAHGHRHRDLRECHGTELREELEGSRARLEEILGRPVATYCYPYGHLDERSARAVEAAGFTGAVGIDPGCSRTEPFALPRMIVRPGDGDFELRLKVTGAYRWWRKLPRLGLLSRLRHR
ncbi:MAG: polysaccharide deacetylase family protein [Acidobacteria bacterium]|nr:polysaccharide deacetylase family protein [Acidobacteriota bacterium]